MKIRKDSDGTSALVLGTEGHSLVCDVSFSKCSSPFLSIAGNSIIILTTLKVLKPVFKYDPPYWIKNRKDDHTELGKEFQR